jgi:hypothetical protein
MRFIGYGHVTSGRYVSLLLRPGGAVETHPQLAGKIRQLANDTRIGTTKADVGLLIRSLIIAKET